MVGQRQTTSLNNAPSSHTSGAGLGWRLEGTDGREGGKGGLTAHSYARSLTHPPPTHHSTPCPTLIQYTIQHSGPSHSPHPLSYLPHPPLPPLTLHIPGRGLTSRPGQARLGHAGTKGGLSTLVNIQSHSLLSPACNQT